MPLEELTQDLKSNVEEAQRLLSGDPENPLIKHLVNTVWPFQEAMLVELHEQAEALDEVVDQSGDMIQPETAGVFAAVILAATKLCDELDRRLAVNEVELRGLLAETRNNIAEATELLDEITIPPGEDDDDEEDDDDGDDDEDEDEAK